MLENLPQHHRVEEAGYRRGPDEVAMDQTRAGSHCIRFLGQKFVGQIKSVRISFDPRNVQASAR